MKAAASPSPCPKCGSPDVRYSSSRLRSLARRLGGSRKRYCAACGERWHIPDKAGFRSFLLDHAAVVVLSCILAGLILAWLVADSANQEEWLRSHPTAQNIERLDSRTVWDSLRHFFFPQSDAEPETPSRRKP